jgi:hypothetical protein
MVNKPTDPTCSSAMTQSYSHRPKADWPAPGRAPLKRPRWPAIVGIVAGVIVLVSPVGAILLLSHLWGFDKPNNQPPRPTATATATLMTLADADTACKSLGLLTTTKEVPYVDTWTGTDRVDVSCILDELDAPPWVSTEISQTPPGTNGVDAWGPFSISWRVDVNGNLNVSIMEGRS